MRYKLSFVLYPWITSQGCYDQNEWQVGYFQTISLDRTSSRWGDFSMIDSHWLIFEVTIDINMGNIERDFKNCENQHNIVICVFIPVNTDYRHKKKLVIFLTDGCHLSRKKFQSFQNEDCSGEFTIYTIRQDNVINFCAQFLCWLVLFHGWLLIFRSDGLNQVKWYMDAWGT